MVEIEIKGGRLICQSVRIVVICGYGEKPLEKYIKYLGGK